MSRGLAVVWLSLGGMLGVNARYWLGAWVAERAGAGFPWATLAINVSGSFAIGLLTPTLPRWWPGEAGRLFLIVGLLGGYTTYSTFALDALGLWERGTPARMLAYLSGSLAGGLVAVGLGVALGRAIVGPGP